MGVLDFTRGRIMARVGAKFQSAMDRRVFDAVIRKSAVAPDMQTQSGLNDLETIQRFITSPILLAFFDLPWTPIFLAGIFIFHPLLGWMAVGSATLLILIALLNQFLSYHPQQAAALAGQQAGAMSNRISEEAEMVQAMGMQNAVFTKWEKSRNIALVS
jgi:ATP-binding cassette subfamily C protein